MSNAPSSSRPSVPNRQPNDADDITWLDFLRTAGGTVPADSSSSTDRKRRHAGSSPEVRRGYPYQTYNPALMTGRMPSGTGADSMVGNSRDTAIDLTTPPRQQRPTVPPWRSESNENSRETRMGMRSAIPGNMSGNQLERRQSEVVLPRWQPDASVTKCPVCQTEFHFFYRKHHCRKCGRVVCAACSPHRITIPRQYIVQPPNTPDGESEPLSPVRNLGGGEVVRVCNPCVPDPWTPGPATHGHPRPPGAPNPGAPPPWRTVERSDEGVRPVPFLHGHPAPAPPARVPRDAMSIMREQDAMSTTRARSQTYQPTTNVTQSAPYSQHSSGVASREPYIRMPLAPPPQTRPVSHRYTQSNNSAVASIPPWRQQSSIPPWRQQAPMPPPAAPQQPRPRREVREEDECPVCGTELPPGDNTREAHIQECIAARFSGTPTSSHPFAPPPPPPRTSSINHPATSSVDGTAALTSTSAPTETTSRPRATSYRPRGMAVYRATEKDCMSEDGEPQECVICFEEFQPGDEMGRMECLCKFHRSCIRQWWDTKGAGSCPTHQLHD